MILVKIFLLKFPLIAQRPNSKENKFTSLLISLALRNNFTIFYGDFSAAKRYTYKTSQIFSNRYLDFVGA